MNIKFIVEYDGSNYKGWQIQKNYHTVQEELMNAFAKVLPKEKINIVGSGRTDAGVHALGQMVSLKLTNSYNLDSLLKSVNSIINNDIYIKYYSEAKDDFHARYSALSREYKYHISNQYSVIKKNFLWVIRLNTLDVKLLRECAKVIIGEHDFSSFSASKQATSNKKCIIHESFWEESKNELIYTVKANRFLHHMVRFLVGTMVQTSRGKMKINDFRQLLDNTSNYSPLCAPAQGLFLNEVFYD